MLGIDITREFEGNPRGITCLDQQGSERKYLVIPDSCFPAARRDAQKMLAGIGLEINRANPVPATVQALGAAYIPLKEVTVCQKLSRHQPAYPFRRSTRTRSVGAVEA